MGLFSGLFGKKVDISNMKTVRVNISWLRGVRIEEWTLGIEIERETVNDFLDASTGEWYVGEGLEKGAPTQHVVKKNAFENVRKEAERIDRMFRGKQFETQGESPRDS